MAYGIAVFVSLFITSLKMRLPLRHAAWRAAFLMAGPGRLVSIIGVTLFTHLVVEVELRGGAVSDASWR